MKFYNRENELELLHATEQRSKNSAQLTIMMGRRRIGKTSLILNSLKGKHYAYLFVGLEPETIMCQRFQRELTSSLGLNIYGNITSFRELFEIIMRESTQQHFSVVFDEVQNLIRINPEFFYQMQEIWDKYHNESHINLIMSGSIHSLMKHIFENHTEPMYGRATSKMTIMPFKISVLKEILYDHNPNYSAEDLLCLYMLTGGVAKYVEILMDNGATTKESMLDYVVRQDSYFLTEGKNMLNDEFSSDYSIYFSIMQLIANGKTRVSEIDGEILRPTSVYLANLEKNYELIAKIQPILARPNSRTTKYLINDNFLRFWFRFILPYQSLIEQQQFALLRQHIDESYTQFSGITLEQIFQKIMFESGKFTNIGNWWDNKSNNEIDIVAINEFNHTGVIAEVKRNPKKIDLSVLEEKTKALPTEFNKYKFEIIGLSLEDLCNKK